MTDSHIELYIKTRREFFPSSSLGEVTMKLRELDDNCFLRLSDIPMRDPDNVFLVSIFAGPIGVDRFMINDWLLGTLKTITCGGFFIWAFIDCFFIKNLTQKRNLKIFNQFVLERQMLSRN